MVNDDEKGNHAHQQQLEHAHHRLTLALTNTDRIAAASTILGSGCMSAMGAAAGDAKADLSLDEAG